MIRYPQFSRDDLQFDSGISDAKPKDEAPVQPQWAGRHSLQPNIQWRGSSSKGKRRDSRWNGSTPVKAAKSGHSQSDDHSCFFLSI